MQRPIQKILFYEISYWICTGLAAAFMIMSAISDITKATIVILLFNNLGYPEYLLPFLGTLKILGAITIVIPSIERIKEWAHAGLVFELFGAIYSHGRSGDSLLELAPSIVALALVSLSYVLFRMNGNRKSIPT